MLPNERLLIQSMNNTQVSFPSATCMHHEFIYQVAQHPQKIAVELDEQSLTYTELLYYVQQLSLVLLNKYHVKWDDIICQCVERSLSMVIGILSIIMASGAYCPLSSQDPSQRLQILVKETRSHLFLVHSSTRILFEIDIVTLNIDTIINNEANSTSIHLTQMSNVPITPENILFVVFTSGSTGIPKAVQLRHRNFTQFLRSFVYADILTKTDTIIQIARCSFDNHLLSLVGTLTIGATLIMLRPEGHMNFGYLARVLNEKQITVMQAVPSLWNSLSNFLKTTNRKSSVQWLRTICSGGEVLNNKLVNLLRSQVRSECRIRNHYDPAEITINCTNHLIDLNKDQTDIPIGQYLPNYHFLILDMFLQTVGIGQEGELVVGGVGVFAGYRGRDDLTAQVMININEQIFYKTGDLVKMDSNGLIHYVGRRDFQVKLRGQRIELQEIVQCLLMLTSVTTCVVIKWDENHLIAYVQSDSINVEQLRHHCQSNLPSHMIPSIFIILEKLPLSPNGKVDRKRLPPPDLSLLTLSSSSSSSTTGLENRSNLPQNQLQKQIHDIWCEILRCFGQHISTTANFFSIAGHSLLFIELYHRYQQLYDFDNRVLSIGLFLQQPTILQHSQLLQSITINQMKSEHWHTLHINQGIASFAQERIFLDEQMRFSNKIAIYNELTALKVIQGSISRDRLLEAIEYILNKHKILRTFLTFNNDNGILEQHIDNKHRIFQLVPNQTFQNENELQDILYQTIINPNLFDLSTGRVFHCEVLRQELISNNNNNNDNNNNDNNRFITDSDILLIAFHHAATDRSAYQLFLNDLCFAYNTNVKWVGDEDLLQYIDYSVHERLIDMKPSRDFWLLELKDYDFEHRLSLSTDQHCLSNDQRSGFASIAQISFDKNISKSFLNYVSTHQTTSFQLGMALFYIFLFKLTQDQNDLCISCHNANRYKTELQNMMGMFISTLPYRMKLDSSWSFNELVKQVQDKCISILEHSHYPLQNILTDIHASQSNVSFLQTVFDFITRSPGIDQLSLDDVNLKPIELKQSIEIAKFDFMLTFIYNPMLNDEMLSCRFVCSHDLFEDMTVTKIARRFQYLIEQLFSMDSNINQTDILVSPITKLSLILPEEVYEMERIVFSPASYAQARIWLDEQIRFDSKNPQVAIYNMPFLHRLSSRGTLSISKLRQALQHVLIKHSTLRTSLYFDTNKNILMQKIIDHTDNKELFTFIESTFETDEDLNKIMHNERGNPNNFNLLTGVVCRCHVVYYKNISQKGIICEKDALIFNFHHALFDFPSMKMFCQDLDQAYTMGYLENDDNTTLRYLDYALVEQQMPMTAANAFWLDALRDCEIDRPLQLPFDRHRVFDEHRTGRGTSISFQVDNDLSKAFLTYASTYNIKLEYLALASYYTFLFKLANNENDICIVMNNHGRSKPELMSIIGMFVNALPMRCQINSNQSFDEFVQHVYTRATQTFEHSYFPLQRILAQHPHISRPTFLDVFFGFVSFSTDDSHNEVTLGDVPIYIMPDSIQINTDEIASKFDFSLSIIHDTITDQLSCSIEASLDLFNPSTTYKIGQRFQILLQQLFTSDLIDQTYQSIHESSIMLPNEKILMTSMNNTQTLFSSSNHCIQHEFIQQVNKQSQKIAMELDEQSLTYNELLYYAQCLSLEFLTNSNFIPGNVVCQCIDRSISMFIGMLSVIMAGGSYCSLSPRDKFKEKTMIININTMIINNNETVNTNHLDLFTTFKINSKNVAFVIFTSGSTGTSKAVQIMHYNLLNCI
ncbi:unnamed protein product [Adineta steineri]|nr:unnamed protein product [Adineta steineri]